MRFDNNYALELLRKMSDADNCYPTMEALGANDAKGWFHMHLLDDAGYVEFAPSENHSRSRLKLEGLKLLDADSQEAGYLFGLDHVIRQRDYRSESRD